MLRISPSRARESRRPRRKSEDFYADQMRWFNKRNDTIDAMALQQRRQRDAEELSSLQDTPLLTTSFAMQRPSSLGGYANPLGDYVNPLGEYGNPLSLHHRLHSVSELHASRRVELMMQQREKLKEEAYFIPRINERSRVLAEKRLKEKLLGDGKEEGVDGREGRRSERSGLSPPPSPPPPLPTLPSSSSEQNKSKEEQQHKEEKTVDLETLATQPIIAAVSLTLPPAAALDSAPAPLDARQINLFDTDENSPPRDEPLDRSLHLSHIQTTNKRTISTSSRPRSSSQSRPPPSTAKTLTSRNIFDRLYYVKDEQKQRQDALSHAIHSQHSYRPDIGRNATRSIESRSEEFYQRLHSHHIHRAEELDKIRSQLQQEHPPPPVKKISLENAEEVRERLLRRQWQKDTALKLMQTKEQQQIEEDLKKGNKVSQSSDKLALERQKKSLQEIFNVLMITAQYRASRDGPGTKEEKSTDREEAQQGQGQLVVKHADASLLQPKELSRAIDIVLKSFTREKEMISKDEFVNRVLEIMRSGALPPIGYLLTQDKVKARSARKPSYITQESREQAELREKPELKAKSVTETLVKEKYKRRHEGEETIFESLLRCKSVGPVVIVSDGISYDFCVCFGCVR